MKTAVALVLFDGVHLGHRAVLKMACEQSGNGLVPADSWEFYNSDHVTYE